MSWFQNEFQLYPKKIEPYKGPILGLLSFYQLRVSFLIISGKGKGKEMYILFRLVLVFSPYSFFLGSVQIPSFVTQFIFDCSFLGSTYLSVFSSILIIYSSLYRKSRLYMGGLNELNGMFSIIRIHPYIFNIVDTNDIIS